MVCQSPEHKGIIGIRAMGYPDDSRGWFNFTHESALSCWMVMGYKQDINLPQIQVDLKPLAKENVKPHQIQSRIFSWFADSSCLIFQLQKLTTLKALAGISNVFGKSGFIHIQM
jgi:hypothetical protein